SGALCNLRLSARSTGLPKDSVANVSQIVTLDRQSLSEKAGRLSRRQIDLVIAGIELVVGRE
ncbi:MAG: type II toxin-antitoxin system PemK/MazF family toxin, partial [Chloroflexota bacterium]